MAILLIPIAIFIWRAFFVKSEPVGKGLSKEELDKLLEETGQIIRKAQLEAASKQKIYIFQYEGRYITLNERERTEMIKDVYGKIRSIHNEHIRNIMLMRDAGEITESQFEEAINKSLDKLYEIQKKGY